MALEQLKIAVSATILKLQYGYFETPEVSSYSFIQGRFSPIIV